jgi:hypothetical protein
MTGFAGVELTFVGDSSGVSERGFLNFCDDFRGGGLGGRGESLFFFFFDSGVLASAFMASAFTVELDDDDSRSDGRP